jgi:hypothetical protein
MDGRLDVLVEPLSLLMSELTEIAARIESVHKSHASRVEAAAVQLRDTLIEQVTADLRQRLDCEFQDAARVIRTELEERMRAAGNQWAVERDSLLRQIATLRKSDRRELSIEIAQSEAALQEVRTTIQAMVSDPSVAISKLVRAKAREGELAAYLKGLHFKAASSGESTTERHDAAIAGAEVHLPA